MRTLIGIFRLFVYGLLCASLIPIQALIVLVTKGPIAYIIPQFFHRFNLKLFNIKVNIIGEPAARRHIVFLSNHLSYLDIEVISAVINTSFIAKDDVANWPLFGILAKLQQTVFISRDPNKAAESRALFEAALGRPMPLVLFAEGTSTNGETVLPFKSTLFDIFLNNHEKIQPVLQPMTLALTHIDGQPIGHTVARDAYAYYGDIVLAPHLWEFAKSRGAALNVVFHPPLDIKTHTDRKSLAMAAQTACAAGLEFAKHDQTSPIKEKHRA